MATYNTLPTVSEDALINEPKAPQNRKAIAIVAAVCFAMIGATRLRRIRCSTTKTASFACALTVAA